MRTREVKREARNLAVTQDAKALSKYISEAENNPKMFRSHLWLARLAYAKIRRKAKQKLRTFTAVAQKMVFYRELRKRLPAFAKALTIL